MCCAYLLYLIIFIHVRIFPRPCGHCPSSPRDGEVRQVEAQGPVPTFKVGVSSVCGEILWPGWPYYGDTQRALLKVVDKSEKSLRALYTEIIGAEPPPKLAVSFQILNIWIFWILNMALLLQNVWMAMFFERSMDLPHKVCCHHRNRNARFCPQLVDSDWLGGNLRDTVVPTGFCSRRLCIGCPLNKAMVKTCDLVQNSLQFVLFFLFVIGLFSQSKKLMGVSKKKHQCYFLPRPYLTKLRPITALTFWACNLRNVSGLRIDLTETAPGLLFTCLHLTYWLSSTKKWKTFKNPQYHLPPSFTTTPFHSKVYAVGSFFHALRISFHLKMAGWSSLRHCSKGFCSPCSSGWKRKTQLEMKTKLTNSMIK